MSRFLKEIYLTAFAILFRFPSWGTNNARIGRAIAAITLIEWFNLLNISTCIEMFVGKQFFTGFSEPEVWVAGFVLFSINVYVLYIRDHGITFEREFDHLAKSRKILLVASCVVVVVATIIFYFYSVSAYHRFFHIVPK
jgi:hypothetical protein